MAEIKKKDVVTPIAAAITGAAVGAGVAIAGAVALKDEKNRKKIKGVLSDLKNRGEEMQKELKKESQFSRKKVKENAKKINNKKTSA